MTHVSGIAPDTGRQWGLFLFIKIGVVEIPPMTFAMLRAGGLDLTTDYRARRRQRIPADPGT